MTITAQQLHDAVDLACDLVADDLYGLPHQSPDNVHQIAAQMLAQMVAFHISQAANPAGFLELLRRKQHDIVARDDA